MKAWQVTKNAEPPEALAIADTALPSPGAGEMRIAVHAAALALPDVMMCRGHYEFKPELPFTAGQEVCGTVLECGEDTSVRVGDRVMGVTSFVLGQGGFAEECMSMEGLVYPAPDYISDVDAAVFCIAFQTAWIALVSRGGLQPGDTVVVLGAAGGCGSAVIQLARALGARVIAVAGGSEKTDFCRTLGADETIDYRATSFVDEVNRLTDNQGAELIFDPVGGDLFEQALGCLASGGRLLPIGYASGRWGSIDTHQLLLRNASVAGVFVGAYDAPARATITQELLALYQQGKIKPHIDAVVALDELPTALNRVANAQVMGRIVMQP